MRISNAADVARLFRAHRYELSLTQQDLADIVGVNRRVIGELERGKGTVRLEIALEVARALGLDIDLSARRR